MGKHKVTVTLAVCDWADSSQLCRRGGAVREVNIEDAGDREILLR